MFRGVVSEKVLPYGELGRRHEGKGSCAAWEEMRPKYVFRLGWHN